MTFDPVSTRQNVVFLVVLLIRTGLAQMSHLYAFNLICTEDHNFSFFRSVPWSCSQYLLCVSGIPFPAECPPGQVFRQRSLRCERATARDFPRCQDTILRGITSTCQRRPEANVGSPISCAQYIRCPGAGQGRQMGGNQGGVTSTAYQLMECSYPFLFSEDTGSCQRFDTVTCEGKIVPRAPCDYVQYQRLCDSTGCPPCSARHPSCVGLGNGFQPLLGKPSDYLACYEGRTLDVRRCKDGEAFSPSTKTCVKQ